MRYEELKMFCSDIPHMKNISEPFNINENEVCATDGAIAIIVKGRGVDSDVNINRVLNQFKPTSEKIENPFSELKYEECKCELEDRCCPCCEGNGMIKVSYDYQSYDNGRTYCETDIPCPICDEWEDELGECKKCHGEKFTFNSEQIKIGNQWFLSKTLFRIKDLEGLNIINGDNFGPARIEFNGGYGLIMPSRDFGGNK